MSDRPAPACANCGSPLSGKYCACCGEKLIEHHDLTVRHFAAHAFEAFTHVDGKISRTLRSLLARPGEMTADYVSGKRQPYIGALQLFLICNVLYFLLQPFTHWDTLSTTLESNLKSSFFQSRAEALVTEKLAAKSMSVAEYAPIYNRAAIVRGKSLAILLVPLCALPLVLLFSRRGRPAVVHLIFALHFCAFLLLALLVVQECTTLLLILCRALEAPLAPGVLDDLSTVLILSANAFYYVGAVRRVYGLRGWPLGGLALILAGSLLPALTGYRWALFLITLRST